MSTETLLNTKLTRKVSMTNWHEYKDNRFHNKYFIQKHYTDTIKMSMYFFAKFLDLSIKSSIHYYVIALVLSMMIITLVPVYIIIVFTNLDI